MDQLRGQSAETTRIERSRETGVRTKSGARNSKFDDGNNSIEKKKSYAQVSILDDLCGAGRKSITNKFDGNESNVSEKNACLKTLTVVLRDICKSGKPVSDTKSDRHVNAWQWLPGDVVWGQVGKFPFWPGIIITDPKESTFTKMFSHGKTGSRRKYHIQFFNDNGSRSWLSVTSILEYKGVEDFEIMKNEKKTRKRISGCRPRLQMRWEKAVEEAEGTENMTRNERIKWFNEKYPIVERIGQTKSDVISKSSKSPSAKEDMKEENVKKNMNGDYVKKVVKGYSVKKAMKGNENVKKILNGYYVTKDIKEDSVKRAMKGNVKKNMNGDYVKKAMKEDSVKKAMKGNENVKKSMNGDYVKKDMKKDSVKKPVKEDDVKASEGQVSVEEPERFTNYSRKRKRESTTNEEATPIKNIVVNQNATPIRKEEGAEENPTSKKKSKVEKGLVESREKDIPEVSEGAIFEHMEGGGKHKSTITNKTEKHVEEIIHFCCICQKSTGEECNCNFSFEYKFCDKFYHLDCLKSFPHVQSNEKTVTCPRHLCHTCISRDTKIDFTHWNLGTCVKCPTTYHLDWHCIPAGTEIVNRGEGKIMCNKHFETYQKSNNNVSGCLVCAADDSLINCETCPAAYHAHCIGISHPEGSFQCPDCQSGRYLMYGEVVWAQRPDCRWWPAMIIPPSEVPSCLTRIPHQQGDFAVEFFGTSSCHWMNRGQAISYTKKIMYLLMVHGQHTKSHCCCCLTFYVKNPLFKELTNCSHDSWSKSTFWNSLWVMIARYFTPKAPLCYIGALCNTRDFVMEYVGEVIDKDECQRRLNEKCRSKRCYCFPLDEDCFLDAEFKGNFTRFLTTSSDPNCELQKWTVNGNPRLGVFAIQDIEPKMELTYSLEAYETQKEFIPDEEESCSSWYITRRRKKTNMKTSQSKPEDDSCFQCKEDGGEFITCGGEGCTKRYHLLCLGPRKKPRGKWLCARHFCDKCGNLVVQMCRQCPTSYCKQHKILPCTTLPSCDKHD